MGEKNKYLEAFSTNKLYPAYDYGALTRSKANELKATVMQDHVGWDPRRADPLAYRPGGNTVRDILRQSSEDAAFFNEMVKNDPTYGGRPDNTAAFAEAVMPPGPNDAPRPPRAAMPAGPQNVAPRVDPGVQGQHGALVTQPPAGPAPLQAQAQKPVSFQDMAKELPEKQKAAAVKQLEQQGVKINEAYADLMNRMGQKPDTKLSKQEKGLLLMEFGLHMMANSARMDTGSNIGVSGLNAIQSFMAMKQGKLDNFNAVNDQRRAALEQYQEQVREDRKQRSSEVGFIEGPDAIYRTDDLSGTAERAVTFPEGARSGREDFVRQREDAARKRVQQSFEAAGYPAAEAELMTVQVMDAGAKPPGEARRLFRAGLIDFYSNMSSRERDKAGIDDKYIDERVELMMREYYGLSSPATGNPGGATGNPGAPADPDNIRSALGL